MPDTCPTVMGYVLHRWPCRHAGEVEDLNPAPALVNPLECADMLHDSFGTRDELMVCPRCHCAV